MERFTITQSQPSRYTTCALCGSDITNPSHLQIRQKDSNQPICRACSRRHAPTMAALVELAGVAQKVGKSSRHLLTPTMESLLDLARAAENYTAQTAVEPVT